MDTRGTLFKKTADNYEGISSFNHTKMDVSLAQLSPDGTRIGLADEGENEDQLVLLDANSGDIFLTLESSSKHTYQSLTFTADSQHLIGITTDSKVNTWHVENKEQKSSLMLEGDLMPFALNDGNVCIYNGKDHFYLFDVKKNGIKDAITVDRSINVLSVSSDGNYFVGCTNDDFFNLKLYEMKTQQLVENFPLQRKIFTAHFSNDNQFLWINNQEFVTKLSLKEKIQINIDVPRCVRRFGFSKNGEYALAITDHVVTLIDTAKVTLVSSTPFPVMRYGALFDENNGKLVVATCKGLLMKTLSVNNGLQEERKATPSMFG